MNYRHAYHAGNFADVIKHALLARILVHLRGKPAAFRVIDTHAGTARYDLKGDEANQTGEWRDGIARVLAARLGGDVERLLAPYLDVVTSLNAGNELRLYPGSPEIVRAHLRTQDRLIACELEPQAAQRLARNFSGDERVKVVAIDGWTALTAYVPPKERRGLVLVDPAFEQPDEFSRLAKCFAAAHRKWSSGTFVLWYPIKQGREPQGLARRLEELGIAKLLRAEVRIAASRAAERLIGCGLIVANPPWTLEGELAVMLPVLAALLARGAHSARIDWLAGEK